MSSVLDLFPKNGPIRYQEDIEGQRIAEDGTILLGRRAGSNKDLCNVVHEMGHFVEIDEARMAVWGWGLTLREVVVCGQLCIEPETNQATLREMRVIAFQANVCESFKVPFNLRDQAKSLRWLPDTTWVPLENGEAPYGEGHAKRNWCRDKIEASQLKWVLNGIASMRKTYTTELFLSEWHRRIALLESQDRSKQSRH